MPLSPIFESFNEDRSRAGNSDRCINLYPEHNDGPEGPRIGLLFDTPGCVFWATVGTGPSRGAFYGPNDVLYVISGAAFYSVDKTGVGTQLGVLSTATGPVQWAANPTQISFVDGVNAYCWDFTVNSFAITIPNSATSAAQPSSMIYQDGFALVNSYKTNEIYQSNFNDFTTYAALSAANDAAIQGNPNNVVAMFDLRREAWMFKRDATEVWVNQGGQGFAFAALQGVYMSFGCQAPYSVAQLGESVAWLGGSVEGNGAVYMSQGYNAVPITTHAMSQLFQSYAKLSDAIAYSYQIDGHYFYVLTFPTQGVTWAYDLVTKEWHQRAYFNTTTGLFERELANWHVSAYGKQLVGDYRNGNIYYFDDNTDTDNGQPRKWLRSWRALPPSQPVGVPMSFDMLQILMETGEQVPQNDNPQLMLRWSDDGGYTWIGQVQVAAGRAGRTAWRVIQNRLGSTTIRGGLDRIWEISSIDPIPAKITGAWYEGGPA